MFERITFDHEIFGGRPCIRRMRIPVSVIVGQVAHGASEQEILKDYPDLESEDIRQALEYAAWPRPGSRNCDSNSTGIPQRQNQIEENTE